MKLGNGNLGEKVVETIQKRRTLLVCLCAMVVFVTTYLLILPAITLDKDTAKDRGGIDLPANELSYEGKGYTIDAAFDAKAGLPEDTALEATEITSKDKDYDAWYDESLKAVQEAKGGEQITGLEFAKFYDISLMADGQELEPEAPVDISISYDKALKAADANHVRIVHFGTDKKGELVPEVLDPKAVEVDLKKGKMSGTAFAAESFSVYGVVYTVDFHYELDGKSFDYSIPGGSAISLKELLPLMGICKAEDAKQFVEEDIADVKFSNEDLLLPAKVTEDTTLAKLKKSLKVDAENLDKVGDLDEAEVLQNAEKITAPDWIMISLQPFDTEETLSITMKNGDVFTLKVTDDRDPLGLDGRTYSILTKKGGTSGHTLQAGVHTNRDSRGFYLESLNVDLNNGTQYATVDGREYVRQDATAWKFEYNADKDAYYISNNGKYLYIDPSITTKNNSQDHSLNLVDNKNWPDEGTLIKITKDDQGNYYFGNVKGTLLWDYSNGYWLSNPSADEGNDKTDAAIRLCLPENPNGSHKASLTAAKDLSIGQTIIIYQKVWNSSKDAYDFYAIDGNGKLQTVWESSDALYWKENLSIEWELREELGDDGNPTGYLQLYNKKTNTYLAPKSDGTGYAVTHAATSLTEADMKKIRVSLPGRDAGEYSSRIATWDYDDNTTYGLDLHYNPTSTTEPYTLEVKELLQSRDFMFAVRDPVVQKQLTTVDTVDSVSKGIKITMYDFNGTNGGGRWYNENAQEYQTSNERLQHMVNVLNDGDWRSGYYTPGLVNRVLGNDGYPVASKTGRSLSDIFEDKNNNGVDFSLQGQPVEANHLFIQSVYDTTGYYYYSGFNNFARLDGNDFVVYEQLGTPRNAGMNNDGTPANPGNFFYYRGNFLPYNELDLTNSVLNYYAGGDQAQVLEDGDPRKSEDLYKVNGNPDYYFGMKMEAKFQQGLNGLSDQGDPMVFEFTGDDDMWVYVDDVLLLDLGGIHDAFFGKINYQTGKITINVQRTSDGEAVTYIKEQYWKAHRFPDGSSWTNRDDPKADEFFTNGGVSSDGKLIGTYKDLSTHDLKMFYMERGAGASNLEIQFNLPVITGDEFRVTKNMLTTATGEPIQSAYADAAFYYEAYIRKNGQWVKYSKNDFPSGKTAVYADDEHTPVIWKEGSNTIFEVKPGQTAIIPVIDGSVEYKVVEVEPEPGTSHMLDLFNVSNSDEDPNDSTSTTGKTVKRRGQVFFDNKPVDEIVNDLRITKNLHGNLYRDPNTSSGYVEDQNGSPYFEYRIWLEATSGDLVPYSLGEYYQIDGKTGKYVYYDKGRRLCADVTADGKYVYTYPESGKPTETLDKPKITEHTSQNGSVGDVRPGDTIIVKGLLEGTDFVVDERLDRTHMRQKSGSGWEENWDNKYYFSHTDVDGAMERNSNGTPTASTKPSNYEIAGHVYDRPVNYDQLSVSGNEARGTIVTDKDAEVIVHNEVYNKFELPLEKTWSEDFDQISLDENAKVTFTLKRYKLEERSGKFTLKANVNNQPAGFDPVYTFTNAETGDKYTVKYSDMAGEGNSRSKTFSLPVGTYAVTHGDDPTGYNGAHQQTANTVTITSNDEPESGATADPSEITITSTFTRQHGNIEVTKTLAGYHGDNSFENFTATYSVTDLAGKAVKNIDGNDVASVTLHYSDFANDSKTITFRNLPSGQYIVKETVAASSYNNDKYTVVNTSSTESGIVSVASGDPAQVSYTSTYTKVQANPVRIYVHDTSYGHDYSLYDDSASFRPGDRVVISFMREANNNQIKYRVNNGSWTQLADVSASQGYTKIREEIRMTVPEGGITVEIQDGWTQIKADDISVVKEQTRLANVNSGKTVTSSAAMGMMKSSKPAAANNLRAAGQVSVDNTAPTPAPSDPKQHYDPDAWQLVVTMKNGGDLLDSEGHKIGTFAINDGKWSVVLKGKDFENLTGTDYDGNRYYYYIDSISETSVPEGTTPSIDTDTVGSTECKRLYSDADASTDKKLSASNEIILANKELTIFKVTKGTTTPLTGAEFTLTLVDEDGNIVEGTNAYTSGEVPVDSTGHIHFTGLKAGRYELRETLLPPGYISKEGPYYITINQDGTSTLDTTVPHTLISPASADAGGVYTIQNEPGAALPNSGGPGTTLIYLIGFVLLIGCGTILAARRRIRRAE